ncbi:apolipoprotein N-acyltransferase [Granulicoccus phenolivorans]|uniref:apolipoprotein N-acyltransferase n=1 Tax=Granulicoccus phenolivorans TaxID=266854 RepID=UPI00042391BB|nr:apolipoprotein N-acyltransferase [Granulicoccus phenolivorans]
MHWNPPRFVPLGVSLICGLLTGLAFEPLALWPLMPLGIAAFVVLVAVLRNRRAFGIGYSFGFGLLGITVWWLSVLPVGPAAPLVAAAVVAIQALYFGLLAIGVRLVRRLPGWPVWVACLWLVAEIGLARFPVGGFGWVRAAYAMVDSPLNGFFPLLGAGGVSWLTALMGAGLAWLVLTVGERRRLLPAPAAKRLIVRHSALLAVGLVLLGVAGIGLRGFQVESAAGSGTIAVGMVQGNIDAPRGYLGPARSVTANHAAETGRLMERARAGEVAVPDFILWPENSTDMDPTRDYGTERIISGAVRGAGVPILVGAIMSGPGPDERQTSSLWWEPGDRITARYDKQDLVPFGEYIPLREVLLPMIPLLALTGEQGVPGTEPGRLAVTVAGRPVTIGTAICYEVAYDDTMREAVTGSNVLVVQSNNNAFRQTPQIEQQFAITRVRAMEARREIVVSTTTSISGYIDRNGQVVQQTPDMVAFSNTYQVPLRTALTPATRIGGWLDAALFAIGLGSVVAALLVSRRRRKSAGTGGSATVDAGVMGNNAG